MARVLREILSKKDTQLPQEKGLKESVDKFERERMINVLFEAPETGVDKQNAKLTFLIKNYKEVTHLIDEISQETPEQIKGMCLCLLDNFKRYVQLANGHPEIQEQLQLAKQSVTVGLIQMISKVNTRFGSELAGASESEISIQQALDSTDVMRSLLTCILEFSKTTNS